MELYERDNHELDGMSRLSAAAQTVWSRHTMREAGSIMDRFRPHVLHVHNTFPLISPSVYDAAARRGIAVVQTLHNFRLICPQGLMLRNGRPCEDCVGRIPLPGVFHACYRHSHSQSAVLATMLTVHRALGTWHRRVSRFIALNAFCRDRFVAGGLPADRISIKPNSVDLPAPPRAARSGFLYVGRLSAEKGTQVLASAARSLSGIRIDVVGSGPEENALKGIDGLHHQGALASEAVYERMRCALALVLPSIWYENYPRTLVEAFACGLPVIASRLGAMAALVEDGKTGLLFEPGDGADLARKLSWAFENPDAMATMGGAARRQYERELSADANYAALMRIYTEAMNAAPTA